MKTNLIERSKTYFKKIVAFAMWIIVEGARSKEGETKEDNVENRYTSGIRRTSGIGRTKWTMGIKRVVRRKQGHYSFPALIFC